MKRLLLAMALTAAGPQAGTFTDGPSLLGIGSGIILSSGDAPPLPRFDAAMPRRQNRFTVFRNV